MTPGYDTISRIQLWFAAQCDGEWEHEFGIKIHTLDNPGWRVAIDLTGTPLEDRQMQATEFNATDTDWWRVWIGDGAFQGASGPRNLAQILDKFLAWANDET